MGHYSEQRERWEDLTYQEDRLKQKEERDCAEYEELEDLLGTMLLDTFFLKNNINPFDDFERLSYPSKIDILEKLLEKASKKLNKARKKAVKKGVL